MLDDSPRQSLLDELDTRQNELLEQLDQLNARIEQVLAQCLAWRGDEPDIRAAAA